METSFPDRCRVVGERLANGDGEGWFAAIAWGNPALAKYLSELEYTEEIWQALSPQGKSQREEFAEEEALRERVIEVSHEQLLALLLRLAHRPEAE